MLRKILVQALNLNVLENDGSLGEIEYFAEYFIDEIS